MRILSFISLIAAMPSFFKMVHERLYGSSPQEKTEDESVFGLLIKTENSFDRFLKNLTILMGTSVLGMVADPPDADEKAETLFSEFKESYNEFISDFRKLIVCLNSRKESLRSSFGSDWLKIESLSEAVSKPGVDWDYICAKKSLVCDSAILKNERRFNSRLFEKMKNFASEELGFSGFESVSFLSEYINGSESLNPAADFIVNFIACPDDSERFE